MVGEEAPQAEKSIPPTTIVAIHRNIFASSSNVQRDVESVDVIIGEVHCLLEHRGLHRPGPAGIAAADDPYLRSPGESLKHLTRVEGGAQA